VRHTWNNVRVSTWFTKQSTAPAKSPAVPAHPPLNLEHAISVLLCKHGRLEQRSGRHLMQFAATTRNADGSTDYLVRTRVHTTHGMERNFESVVRVFADRQLRLIR
jgi:hypothetical protein